MRPYTHQFAAEQGPPTAHLALAQLYAARRAGPKDLVHAYMWFLIAGEQITQAKNHVNQSMTMEPLLEAEPRAAEWIRKKRKSTLIDRKSSQRIYCLIQRKISHSSRVPNRDPELNRPIYNFRFTRNLGVTRQMKIHHNSPTSHYVLKKVPAARLDQDGGL